MATNFPGSLDNSTSLPYPTATNDTNSPSLAGGQDNQNDAVIATQTKLGINSSTATTNSVLLGVGSGESQWGSITGAYTSGSTGTGNFVLASGGTLSSPTINTPTINNPTLKTDSVVGYTTSNAGTVYGISITGGNTISTALTLSGALKINGGISSTSSGTIPSNLFYNPYKFLSWRNAAFNATNTATALVFDEEVFDTSSNYSTSTGKFTAPINGFYQFTANFFINTGSPTTMQISIYVNGNPTFAGPVSETGAGNFGIGLTTPVFQLSATNYVQMYMTAGGTLTGIPGETNTYFGGNLVSAT